MTVESFSLPELIHDEIVALVKTGYYSSKSDVAKDAFRCLLEHKPELKSSAAVELFKTGKVSLGKAAEIAGVSTPEFKQMLADRKVMRKIHVGKPSKKAAAVIKAARK